MNALKQKAILNIKNIIGWKTNRRIIVFAIDDYGNVRVASKAARERMDVAGLKIDSRYDQYDSLEDEEDLLSLYETLNSVKDKNGNAAIFTALSVPANIDFEKMKATNYQEYHYETLPETFAKLPGYENVWELWKEGISKKLIFPQFHGREHLNIKLLKENLAQRDKATMIAFDNRSYTSFSNSPYPTISNTASFDFHHLEENEIHKKVIEDGLNVFEKVFGFRSVSFNPPGGREHPALHETLAKNGVKYIETPLLKREHQGNGVYKKIFNYTGKKSRYDQFFLVRNCVFEPTEPSTFSWVQSCMKQIEVAFRWNRPAIISSHRVNFCGHIDPANRKKGLNALNQLLSGIESKWPDVEFMTTASLGELISNRKTAQ